MKVNQLLTAADKLAAAVEINAELFDSLDPGSSWFDSYPVNESTEIAASMPDIITPGFWRLLRSGTRGDVDYDWTDLTSYSEFMEIPAQHMFSSQENGCWAFLLEVEEDGSFKSIFSYGNSLDPQDSSQITWGPNLEDYLKW